MPITTNTVNNVTTITATWTLASAKSLNLITKVTDYLQSNGYGVVLIPGESLTNAQRLVILDNYLKKVVKDTFTTQVAAEADLAKMASITNAIANDFELS